MTAIQTEVSQKQRECEVDVLKAEPALVAATAALNTLNRVKMITGLAGFLQLAFKGSQSLNNRTQSEFCATKEFLERKTSPTKY